MARLPIDIDPAELTALLERLGFVRGGAASYPDRHQTTQPLNYSKTEEVFSKKNVTGNGTSDDAGNLQEAVNQMMHEEESMTWPTARYKISHSVKFTADEPDSRYRIHGHGAIVIADFSGPHDVDEDQEDLNELYHDVMAQEYPGMLEFSRGGEAEYQVDVAGFHFDGNHKKGIIGCKGWGVTYSRFHDMTMAGCWVGMRHMGWGSEVSNMIIKGGYIGLYAAPGDRSGCTLGHNQNLIHGIRCYGSQEVWNTHQIRPLAKAIFGGRGNVVSGMVYEGKVYRFSEIWDYAGSCSGDNVRSRAHNEEQDWEGVSRTEARGMLILEQMHDIIIERGFPRWGIKVAKAGTGKVIVKDVIIDNNHPPRKIEGMDRELTVVGYAAHGVAADQATMDKYKEALGVEHMKLIVDGQHF